MKKLTDVKAFEILRNGNKPVLIDFYADWCPPCQALMPTIDKLADKYEDQMEIVKVNVDEFQGLAQEFGVRSIPALFVLNNGEIDHALKGFQTEQTLEEIIQSYGVIA